MCDLLIIDIFQLQRLYYICDKLRVDVRVPNFVMKKLLDSAGELRTDLLRFVADIHPGNFDWEKISFAGWKEH